MSEVVGGGPGRRAATNPRPEVVAVMLVMVALYAWVMSMVVTTAYLSQVDLEVARREAETSRYLYHADGRVGEAR